MDTRRVFLQYLQSAGESTVNRGLINKRNKKMTYRTERYLFDGVDSGGRDRVRHLPNKMKTRRKKKD